MKIKDLINALEKCDKEQSIFIENCIGNELKKIITYDTNGHGIYTYLCDDEYYLDDYFLNGYKDCKKKVVYKEK